MTLLEIIRIHLNIDRTPVILSKYLTTEPGPGYIFHDYTAVYKMLYGIKIHNSRSAIQSKPSKVGLCREDGKSVRFFIV